VKSKISSSEILEEDVLLIKSAKSSDLDSFTFALIDALGITIFVSSSGKITSI
jgi:hypothetical protein